MAVNIANLNLSNLNLQPPVQTQPKFPINVELPKNLNIALSTPSQPIPHAIQLPDFSIPSSNTIKTLPFNIDPNVLANIKQLNQDDYLRMDLIDQIYKEPDMYLGAVAKEPRDAKVLDFSDPQNPLFKTLSVEYPTGAERTYLEPLYNASDNVIESRSRGHAVGAIQIQADLRRITIRNGGVPIPIQINTKENKWVPEMIFGVLLTSGQYKKEVRTGSGKNGYGAKLTNIFSKYFEIIIGNPYDGKLYRQIWRNNMKICEAPLIQDGYTGEPFVQVTYELDFERFGYTEYPTEVLSLYAAYAAEVAFTLSVPVVFNGISLTSNDILDFKRLTGYTTQNYIVHYEYPEGTPLKEIKLPNGTRMFVSTDPNVVPTTKLCIFDAPDEGDFYAFSNSSNNREGGVHIEAAYDIINEIVTADINNSIKRKKDEKVARKHTLTKADLKRHTGLIISCELPNPRWKSQDKLYLTEPKPKIKIDSKILKTMTNWEMALRMYGDLEAKLNRDLGNGKKKKFLNLDGYDPAYYAGKRGKNLNCVLYEVEGKSAMGYAYNMKSEMSEEKRDYVGIFAQMGKPLNVMTAKLLTLVNSKKYLRLIEALGLQEGLDYTKPENRETLNYGVLALLNDSDVDGKHITALLLNQLYCRYRSLLQIPFVVFVRTPIIRIWKGKDSHKFYSYAEYTKFMQAHPECTKWETKYYKGLASSDPDEVAEETRNPRIVYMVYDDTCPKYFNLAFSKDKGMTDERKKWIANYQLMDGIEEVQMLPISKFLNFEFIHHAVANLARTIPRFDSLKIGQRKIVFGSHKHWKSKIGTSTDQKKTNHLANQVSEVSNYHHGEKSLIDTINNMILQYPGTNNLRFFVPKGMFGTRNDAGEDAGDARYTYCYPEWWFPYIFMQDDVPLLKDVIDEEQHWEPEVYLPVLPLILFNGALGIGTGSSTFIPNCNPVDLAMHLIDLISGVKPAEILKPWYRGFKGTIELVKRSTDGPVINPLEPMAPPIGIDFTGPTVIPIEGFVKDDPDNPDAPDPEPREAKLEDLNTDAEGDFVLDPDEPVSNKSRGGMKMVTTGVFEIIDNNDLVVTEIPIGMSFKQFTQKLERMKEKKEIRDYKKSCKHDEAKFFVYGYREMKTAEKLGLIKAFSLTNMVLLDEENRPQKFKDLDELLFKWYEWRLPYYTSRKSYLLKEMMKDINHKMLKMKFIMAVIDGVQHGYIAGQNIVVMNKSRNEIIPQMTALGIPSELLAETKISSCTLEELQKLQNKINTLYAEYQTLEKTTPQQLWIVDINKFLDAYLKRHPEEKTRVVLYNQLREGAKMAASLSSIVITELKSVTPPKEAAVVTQVPINVQ